MKRKETKKRLWSAAGYGSLGGLVVGPLLGAEKTQTAYYAAKDWAKYYAKRKPKLSREYRDYYFKQNPSAKQYYDFQSKHGNKRATQNLLKKIGAFRGKGQKPIKHFGVIREYRKAVKEFYSGSPQRLAIFDLRMAAKPREKEFFKKIIQKGPKRGSRIVLGATALGAIYGYQKKRAASKKRRP